MPAGIKDAFRSPSSYLNPSNNSYELNSFNKNSLGDTNTNYVLTTKLPDYSPYPRLEAQTEHKGVVEQDPHEPCYLKEDTTDLINRVLSNKKCCSILKKILIDEKDDDIINVKTEKKDVIEGFSFNEYNVRNIIIYCLSGILLLCILELIFKIVQLMRIGPSIMS